MAESEIITFDCPHCGAAATVRAVQGDRCPRCGWEITWFRPNEEHLARDFHACVTGEKHLVALPGGRGWASVHP